VNKIKELEKERDEVLKKHNLKDPSQIIRQIKAMEMKIETVPMSFEKEKELMKQIKT
jgi:uncharacterized coiled-coil DUF342 family protein